LPKQRTTDTSDAVYEKRHRKYELIEKRQRLREKEKLKHEQYKLKERIEQLRSMDGSAFLSLPSSSFSPIPIRSNEEDDEESVANLLKVHADSTPTHSEGERRRKEMLDLALALEERYRALLPPERKGKNTNRASVEPNGDVVRADGGERNDDGESELDPEEKMVAEKSKISLKIKFPSRVVSNAISASAGRRKASLLPCLTRTFLSRRIKSCDYHLQCYLPGMISIQYLTLLFPLRSHMRDHLRDHLPEISCHRNLSQIWWMQTIHDLANAGEG
jgi:hypothetical protein